MEQSLDWLALKSVPGIGNHLCKRLLDRFRIPSAVRTAAWEELVSVEGISPRLATAIQKLRIPDTVRRELDQVYRDGYHIVTMDQAEYPSLLRELPDPPPFLYVSGSLVPSSANIAMVGSRRATQYGANVTRRLAGELSGHGLTVVSGMARGIDTAAHQGTLKVGGKTIAVLGSGFDHIYPLQNRKLFDHISESGAVVTEFPMATLPESGNFPRRNRIISGMSMGTVVVEATRKSGSLITARLAAEQNREVFAVPGSIYSGNSAGTHLLIREGAKLVESAGDVLEELGPYGLADESMPVSAAAKAQGGKTFPGELNSQERKMLACMEVYPLHIDELTRKTALSPAIVSAVLLQLELKRLVCQSPGKMFLLVK